MPLAHWMGDRDVMQATQKLYSLHLTKPAFLCCLPSACFLFLDGRVLGAERSGGVRSLCNCVTTVSWCCSQWWLALCPVDLLMSWGLPECGCVLLSGIHYSRCPVPQPLRPERLLHSDCITISRMLTANLALLAASCPFLNRGIMCHCGQPPTWSFCVCF